MKVQPDFVSPPGTFAVKPQDTFYVRHLKAVFDKLTAVVLLIVLSPLLVLTAALVRLTSPGPALFKQPRLGKNGEVFTMWKFRSMTEMNEDPVREESWHPDPMKITLLGKFLRRTRIDELPQLVNVLRGEMSMIGPRPETQKVSAELRECFPEYRFRLLIKPGVTGRSHVLYGRASSLDGYRKSLAHDLEYIRSCSFVGDLVIVLRTFWVIVSGFGAR